MHKLIFLTFIFVLCFTFSGNAQKKSATNKTKNKVSLKGIQCKSNKISFPCPKEYKILLNGNESTSIFLAKNLEFGYSVFVIAPKDKYGNQRLMTDAIKTLLNVLYPKESQNYRWKEVGFANKKVSSKFETERKSSIGFNDNQIVTVDYRYISFENKNVIIGTIVEGFFKGNAAENEYIEGRYTTNSGCFDAIKIIHSITSEKDSDELDPCRVAIITERKN